MSCYACYDSDGRVAQLVDIPDDVYDLASADFEGRLLGISRAEFEAVEANDVYVSFAGGQAHMEHRSGLDIQSSIGGLSAVISGVVSGSTVESGGLELVSDGQPIEIEFDAPGTYEVRIYPPPQYRNEVLEVTVG